MGRHEYKEATRKRWPWRETSGNICPRFFSTSSRRYSAVRTLSTLDIPPAGVVAFLDFRVCLSLASALTSSCHALVTARACTHACRRAVTPIVRTCVERVTQACEIYRRHPHACTRCVRAVFPRDFSKLSSRRIVRKNRLDEICVSIL